MIRTSMLRTGMLRTGMLRSLRMRLVAALGLTLLIGCGAWFVGMCVLMNRQQDGYWDRMLRNAAEQVLLSLPSDLDTIAARSHLRLPDDASSSPSGKFDKLLFQVWVLDRRESVVASVNAPVVPLRPDFADGYADTTIDGDRWRVFAVTDAGGQVQVQAGHAEAHRRLEAVRWIGGGLGIALLVLAGLSLATWIVVFKSFRPVLRIREAIAAREPLDLTPLPGANLPDEVRPLVDSFNGLLARLDQALQSERQFLSEAAHELRTPLAALLTQAQVAQHSSSPEESRRALEQLVRGIERTSRLAQQLLDSARVENAAAADLRAPVGLAEVVAMVAREFELIAMRKRQTLALDTDSGVVEGDLDDLGILLRNLVDNALRYSPEGARVEIGCRSDPAAGTATLHVRDDGPGVDPAERERIFERFFRGSNGNGERGSGIGLSLVTRIAQAHGAQLRAGTGIGGRGFGVEVVFRCAHAGCGPEPDLPATGRPA